MKRSIYSPQKFEELGNMLAGLDAGNSIVIAKSFYHMLTLANLAEEVQIAYWRRIKLLKKGDFADENSLNSAITESDIEETFKRLVNELKLFKSLVYKARLRVPRLQLHVKYLSRTFKTLKIRMGSLYWMVSWPEKDKPLNQEVVQEILLHILIDGVLFIRTVPICLEFLEVDWGETLLLFEIIKSTFSQKLKTSFTAAPMVGHLGILVSFSGVAIAMSFAEVAGFSVLLGTLGALETLCGQSYGAEDFRKFGNYTCSAIVTLIAVCFRSSLVWIFTDKTFLLFSQDPGISHLATIWLRSSSSSPGVYNASRWCGATFETVTQRETKLASESEHGYEEA